MKTAWSVSRQLANATDAHTWVVVHVLKGLYMLRLEPAAPARNTVTSEATGGTILKR